MNIFQFFYYICELLFASSYMFLMNKIILYKDNLNILHLVMGTSFRARNKVYKPATNKLLEAYILYFPP